MKGTIILVLFILSTGTGCDDNDSVFNPDEEFKVTVVNAKDFTTCGLPLISFTEKLDKIKELTSSDVATFNAVQLKEEFQIEGLKLIVKVRKTRDDETSPCLNWGISWPWVTVVDSRIEN